MSMNLDEYQKNALATLSNNYDYGDVTPQMMGMVLGLAGESGEVLEKFKKILCDKQGKLTEGDKKELGKELGDILWCVTTTAHLLGSSLEEVARQNNEKLASRKNRDALHGSGDNR